MQRRIKGFTLIEMTMVIILISIVATATYLNWPGVTINLGAEVYQVANDIRYTQSLSMTKRERFRFVRTSASSYQIMNSTGTAILSASGVTTVTLNSGITFGAWSNLPNNLIVFDGKGTPYTDTATPGTPLASAATIPLTGGGQTTNIVISPETGRVIVQ